MKKLLTMALALCMLVMPLAASASPVEWILGALMNGQSITFTESYNMKVDGLLDYARQTGIEVDENAESVLNLAASVINGITVTGWGQLAPIQGGAVISINGTDAATIALEGNENGLYLYTDIIGQTLGISMEDLTNLINQALAQEGVDLETLMQAGQAYAELVQDAAQDFSLENTQAVLNGIMSRLAPAETYPEANLEGVAAVYTITLTPADVADLFEAVVKDIKADESAVQLINSFLQMEGNGADAVTQMDEYVSSLRESANEAAEDDNLDVYLYMSEEGNVIAVLVLGKGANCAVITRENGFLMMVESSDESSEDYTSITFEVTVAETHMEMTLDAINGENTVSYSVVADVEETDTTYHSVCDIQMKAVSGEVSFEFPINVEMNAVTDGGAVSGTVVTTTPFMDETVIFTTSEAYESIAGGEVVYPLSMSEDELGQWIGSISMTAMGKLAEVVSLLPEEVQNLMMNLMTSR